jgi:hypothetical protein
MSGAQKAATKVFGISGCFNPSYRFGLLLKDRVDQLVK